MSRPFERVERNLRIRELRTTYVAVPVAGDLVSDPKVIAEIVGTMFKTALEPQETLYLALVDPRDRLLGIEALFTGSLTVSNVSCREIVTAALLTSAASVVLLHNHPSTDPNPSPEDVVFTKKAIEACRLVNVEVLDHVVLGANADGTLRHVSLKARGYMQ